MRIFITGCKGQLGRALYKPLAPHTVAGCDLPETDVTDRHAIAEVITDFAPQVVIHTAAWTNVDGCARDPAKAYGVNALGTQYVAIACAACDAALLYVSTNEVFDGQASKPYREWDRPHPINPYARSKAAGEWFTRHLLTRFYIARTAWLYGREGSNFPHTILRLADEAGTGPAEGQALRVVTDEVGNPTFAPDLASALAQLVQTGAYGVYHLTNAGYASRYDFAREILRLTGREHVAVEPITLDEFERDSTPPRFAPLANTAADALGIRLRPWKAALAEFLEAG
jgi:dTDP-4-dehydrorhamnose reductase